jgi:hypothetical protein
MDMDETQIFQMKNLADNAAKHGRLKINNEGGG